MRLFKLVFVLNLLLIKPLFTQENGYVVGLLAGRLGNCFFEIAGTSALAWDHEVEAYFPELGEGWYQDYYHQIFFKVKTQPPSQEISVDWLVPTSGYVPIDYQPKMRVRGFGQNEKYFAHHRERLLELFAPHPAILEYVKDKYSWILEHPNTVSVHVRHFHGEMDPTNEVFMQYDSEYFKEAMALFDDSSLFVVTSDNIDFAKKNIPIEGKHVVFVEEPYQIDFLIQRLCKNNIISNSSYSWWSAWLNENPNKIVVRPDLWLNGYCDVGGPDDWIKIAATCVQDRQRR